VQELVNPENQTTESKLDDVLASLDVIKQIMGVGHGRKMYENMPQAMHQPPCYEYDPTQQLYAPYHIAPPQRIPGVQGSQDALEAWPQQYALEAPPQQSTLPQQYALEAPPQQSALPQQYAIEAPAPQQNLERLQNALKVLQNSQATSKGVVEGSTWRHMY
jgi:hypothetical protein